MKCNRVKHDCILVIQFFGNSEAFALELLEIFLDTSYMIQVMIYCL